jgi:hypothetical protein
MTNPALRFYVGTVVALAALFVGLPPGHLNVALADYQEECLNEGCSGEEVRELYSSYQEECLNEGCSLEEVFELGGTDTGVRQMLADFERRGFRVDPRSAEAARRGCLGTTTHCYGFVYTCNDHCIYPDGSTSSEYVCGGCIGFW